MDSYLTDLSDRALAVAARRSLCHALNLLADSPVSRTERGEGWVRWRTDVLVPFGSGLLCERGAEAVRGSLVAETVAALAEAVPFWSVWFSHDTDPDRWEETLASVGLIRVDEVPEMAVAIDALPWHHPLPDGLTVETVADAEGMRVWTETMVAGYGVPSFSLLVAGLDPRAPYRFHLGRLDGVPVATSATLDNGEVAAVGHVATLPAARGRGVGGAMTLEALREPRAAGCRASILQASPMGFPVYERLGFRTVGHATYFTWPTTAPHGP